VGKQERLSPEILSSLDLSFGSFLCIKAKKGTGIKWAALKMLIPKIIYEPATKNWTIC
jgi:hypothetical protein